MKDRSQPDAAIKIDPRQELILKAIFSTGPTRLAYYQEWLGQADLDHIDEGSFRLIPLLYKRMSTYGIEAGDTGRLKGIYRYAFYKNQLLFHQVHKIIQLLHEAGIQVMMLKGGALTLKYYGDYGVRPMGDIDILVGKNNVSAAMEILQQNGWLTTINITLDDAMHMFHSVNLINSDNQGIDLHWYVMHQCCWENVDDDLWAYADTVDFRGLPICVLGPADQILHNCAHGIIWNQVSPIRWIVDSITVLEKEGDSMDWPRLLLQTEKRQLTLTLSKCLAYINSIAGPRVPDWVMAALETIPISQEEKRLFLRLTAADSLFNLKSKWAHHAYINRDSHLGRLVLTFPAFLRSLWGLKSYQQFPAYIWGKFTEKTITKDRSTDAQ